MRSCARCARSPCRKPDFGETSPVETRELTGAELRAWKQEEARERRRLLARGESGAWPWPEGIRLGSPSLPDERWLCELELAGG